MEYNGGNPRAHIGNTQAGIRFESSKNSLQITSSNVEISGSDVSIQTPKIFLGQGNSNFISASNSNIEISASGFHLKPEGDAILSGSITANQGSIGNFDISSTLSSGNAIVLNPNQGGRITFNNKTDALSTTKGIFIGSSSVNNVEGEYMIALGDTITNEGSFFAIAGPSSDYVYIGEFGQANSTNNDITQMSGSFISYKSSNKSIAISSKNFKIDETGDIQISSSGDSAQILLDVDEHKQQGIEINSNKGIFGYGDKDGTSKQLETHGGMFKFTAAPVSIEGGLGGQGWPVDDTSDAPPTTYSDDSDLSSGGYSGT